MRCKLSYAIHQVQKLRQGLIHEFTLTTTEHHTFSETDQILLDLATSHTVKKLTLDFFNSKSNGLPLSVFSLHHLMDLYLAYCDIDHKLVFNVFGSLTSLSLNRVTISMETLLHILSNCPSLKSCSCLPMAIHEEAFLGYERPNIVELFKCLPVIEQFTTWDYFFKAFVLEPVRQVLPTSLIHLKYFCFEDMGFVDGDHLAFLAVLVKCSPNLEKIKLEIDTYDGYDVESVKLEERSFKLEDYSDIWLENLNELEIEIFRNFKPKMEFVKFILVRSPNLKKLIFLSCMDSKNEELEILVLKTAL
ncbi:hypothetical protein L1987_42465 [Smallanthus sonchifolius]|uniref:Uncharacterized protein n=1 Tax=Smallanthus sonchifolius TaxID=185202 RepID=A0ACB9GK63_9ASTR|nr:hypothetical protein L1987_42465 [Smallanthus sonchifolius]